MTGRKILLTGATGYIGGSVLSQLLDSEDINIKQSQISVILRGESRAKPFKDLGLNTILFESLDDVETIEKASSEHDVVIGTTLGYHTGSAVAILKGLSKRKASGKEVMYIHTDGTSNLGDQPISGKYLEPREFSDMEDDIYAYLLERQSKQVYIQRTTSLTVIETGKKLGVPTYTMMSPAIYGIGNGGRFGGNVLSVMIPMMMRSSLQTGKAAVIGNGQGIWNYVHVLDLAMFYELILSRLLAGEKVPSGEKGIFFSGTGSHTWMEAAEGIASAGFELGALKTKEVESISLEEAANRWNDGDLLLAELGLASNSRTRSDYAQRWGWKPLRTKQDFQNHFRDEFFQILKSRKS